MPNVEPSDVPAINAMSRAAFDQLLASVDRLIRSTPVLSDFVRWDGGYTQAHVPPLAIPAIERIQRMSAAESASTAPVAAAVRAVAQQAHWQQTYREDEVGKDFLERYGWFELVGPFGHFHDDMLRAYLAYWGDHLNYPWHLHEAEELYFILAGGAAFEAEGLPRAYLTPGQSRRHRPNQPHAMTTGDEPVLALILWRGAGLDGSARLSPD